MHQGVVAVGVPGGAEEVDEISEHGRGRGGVVVLEDRLGRPIRGGAAGCL